MDQNPVPLDGMFTYTFFAWLVMTITVWHIMSSWLAPGAADLLAVKAVPDGSSLWLGYGLGYLPDHN